MAGVLHRARRGTAAAFAAGLLGLLLSACASSPVPTPPGPSTIAAGLLPADALLLGEQHDAAEHHVIELQVVQLLVARGQLAALVLEMAEQGNETGYLPPGATEDQVRTALGWDDKAWPWSDYGPAVLVAVRAGVPVFGANLPRERMRDAMADVSLDAQLGPAARAAQQEAVRDGHCRLLPEAQIAPMTRIQIARDRSMAQTILKARVPGRTVLLVSGAAHGDKLVGVPQQLPTEVPVKVFRLQAGDAPSDPGTYDAIWRTPALPEKDYCAELRPRPKPAG